MEIRFQDVTKSYLAKRGSVEAVSKATWSATGGAVYGILGPNGSGKTTMIRMLVDLIRPDLGVISVNGSASGNRGAGFRREVGFLPEERGLYKNEKALDLLTYLAELKGVERSNARTRAKQLLSELGLEAEAEKSLKTFSKGMTQKVQIIAAIQHDPKLLILDEPFSGLDPINVRLVRDFIRDQRSRGAVVLLCTHMMDEAERLCDHVILMSCGKIIANGPQKELRQQFGKSKISLGREISVENFRSVAATIEREGRQEIELHLHASISTFLEDLALQNVEGADIQIAPASLEEVFITLVTRDDL